MRNIDQVKYDIGQKAYIYDEGRGKVIECTIWCIHINESGVSYDIEPNGTSMLTSDEYIERPQKYLFAKKSEALAHAIEVKNRLLQEAIRNLGIDELKKELAKAKEEEKE